MITSTDTANRPSVKIPSRWQKRIDHLMETFDFKTAVRVMNFCGYTESNGQKVTVDGAKRTAQRLMEELVTKRKTVDWIRGHFTVMILDEELFIYLSPVDSDTLEVFSD